MVSDLFWHVLIYSFRFPSQLNFKWREIVVRKPCTTLVLASVK
jgi:hypothetical protein